MWREQSDTAGVLVRVIRTTIYFVLLERLACTNLTKCAGKNCLKLATLQDLANLLLKWPIPFSWIFRSNLPYCWISRHTISHYQWDQQHIPLQMCQRVPVHIPVRCACCHGNTSVRTVLWNVACLRFAEKHQLHLLSYCYRCSGECGKCGQLCLEDWWVFWGNRHPKLSLLL